MKRRFMRYAIWILVFSFFQIGHLAAADVKIGVVNTARLLKEAPQAEAARKRLERTFAPREQKIVDMQKKLQKLDEKLAKDGAIMSDAQRRQVQGEYKSQERNIKRAKEEFNEDLNLRRNEELNKLQKLVFEAIVSLAREKNYDAILGESIYASDKVDVTGEVLEKLRQEFEKSASTSGK